MLLAAGVMFLVEYAGYRAIDPNSGKHTYRHGWPFVWADGRDGHENHYGPRWWWNGALVDEAGPIVHKMTDDNEEELNPWLLHDDIKSLNVARLLLDAGGACLGILGIGWAFQLWRKRHGSLLRYRLRTMLAVVALLALVIAPIASWHRESLREEEIIARLASECVRGLAVSETEVLYNNGSRVQEKEKVAGLEFGTVWSPPDWLPDGLAKIGVFRRLFDRARWIAIRGDRFTDSTLGLLAELSHLENLEIAKGQVTPEGLQILSRLTNLRTLKLHETAINDQQLSELSGLAQLEFLELGNADVSDAGLAPLVRLHDLGVLWLADRRITGEGLLYLKAIPHLTGLVLEADGMTDKGLLALEQLPTLKGLTLSRMPLPRFRFAGFPQLVEFELSENLKLSSIDLRDAGPLTHVTIKSVASDGQISYPKVRLGKVDGFQELHLVGATLDAADISLIAEAPRLWTLDLQNIRLAGTTSLTLGSQYRGTNISVGDSDFTQIRIESDQSLRSLRCSRNPGLTAVRLIDMPGLESVELADNPRLLNLADGALRDVERIPELRELHLSGSEVRDADLAPLAALPSLKTLDLSRCNISGKGLVSLVGLAPFSTVDLRRTPVSDEAVAALQKALPGLSVKFEPKKPVVQDLRQQAALVRNQLAKVIECKTSPWKLADDDFACLEGLANLDTLDLSDTHLTDAGLEHIRRLPRLRELILCRTQVTDAAVRTLKEMPALVHVDIEGTRITDEGRRALGPLAKKHAPDEN